MNVGRRHPWASLGLLVCGMGLVTPALAQDMRQLLRESPVDLVQAAEAALKEIPGAALIEIDLERAGADTVWELDLLADGKLLKAQVDRHTAKVLKTWDASAEEPGEVKEAQQAASGAKVDWRAAVETAQRAHVGAVVYHVELELEHGTAVYAVAALADGRRAEIEVDGVSGKLRAGERAASEARGKRGAEDEEDEVEEAEEHHERGARAERGADERREHRTPGERGNEYTETFGLEAREFTSTGRNPYFILEPGYQLVLEGKEGRHTVQLTITVLDETHPVGNVETRVVEERETKDGALAEVSRNYFAICKRTNDVFYFGETTDAYRDGKVVDHEGAWEAGQGGARPGLMMPGTPLLGARYYQELAKDVALDRAEIVSLTGSLDAPAGSFTNCLKVLETTPLERGEHEYKLYAPGVGLIQDEALKLTAIKRP